MQKFRILAPTHIFCEGSMENAWLWIHRSCWDECQIKEKNWHDWREGWPVGWCAAHQLFTACFNSNILQRRKVINWISIVSLTWFKFNCDFSERYIVWTCFQISSTLLACLYRFSWRILDNFIICLCRYFDVRIQYL